ncbi:MAG: cation:proton antiporter subunit C [Defluviitaleaceae bacterium]|nr:cation:proton antiporter subunit C [Defluviitaleaceae bacterium]
MSNVELVSIIVFFLAFYALVTNRNIIRTIIFSSLMEVSVITFWLSIGFRERLNPPILYTMADYEHIYTADPVTQALMLTAVVIGIAVTAIKTIMFITLYRKYKTTDWDLARIRKTEG